MAGGINPGIGTTVTWDTTAIGAIISWDGPKYSRDTIQTTTVGVASGSHFRGYKKGINDAPEVSFVVQFDAGDAGLVKIMAELESDVWSDEKVLLLTFNDTGGVGNSTFSADAILTAADFGGADVDNMMTVAITAKFVGKPTYTAGS